MSFWINYTGRRDEYPLPDDATNRGQPTKSKRKRKKKLPKKVEKKVKPYE